MKMLEPLRKAFGYVLLSMGVSSSAKMIKPASKVGPKTDSGAAPEGDSARRMDEKAQRGS